MPRLPIRASLIRRHGGIAVGAQHQCAAFRYCLPGKPAGPDYAAWRHGSIDVVLSDWILDELHRVLPKLEHRYGLSPAEIADLVDILSIQAELVEPAATDVPALRDADDGPVLGMLLEALHNGGADYLVTGDKDLLTLASGYPIITPAEFWAAHGSGT